MIKTPGNFLITLTDYVEKSIQQIKNMELDPVDETLLEYLKDSKYPLHLQKRSKTTKANVDTLPWLRRVVNHLMTTKFNCGKMSVAIKVLEGAFAIIESKLRKNPVTVLKLAILKAGPKVGGRMLPYGAGTLIKRVVYTPRKILSKGIKNLIRGHKRSSLKGHESLAKEIIATYEGKPSNSLNAVKNSVKVFESANL